MFVPFWWLQNSFEGIKLAIDWFSIHSEFRFIQCTTLENPLDYPACKGGNNSGKIKALKFTRAGQSETLSIEL